MAHFTSGNLIGVVPENAPHNTIFDMLNRTAGRVIEVTPTIVFPAGPTVASVFKFTKSVRILDQWAEIISISGGDLSGLYADAYDGTNVEILTADGLDLTGAPAGTFFTKDKVKSQPYSANIADQVRVLETLEDRKAGRPFTPTGKNGVDNFIRLHAVASAEVTAQIKIHFEYWAINGGTLESLL